MLDKNAVQENNEELICFFHVLFLLSHFHVLNVILPLKKLFFAFTLTGPILAVYCTQLLHAFTCPFSKCFQSLYIFAQIF